MPIQDLNFIKGFKIRSVPGDKSHPINAGNGRYLAVHE